MSDSPNTIESRLERTSKASGYSFDLLLVVYQSIPRTDERQLRLSSDTKMELRRILKYLHDRYFGDGDIATELASLKVRSFHDLAGAVKALEYEGLVVCPPEFYVHVPSVFAFHATLAGLDEPVSFRWSITDIFVVTTVGAVFLAGFRSRLQQGPYFTLAAGTLIMIGLWALFDGKHSEIGKQSSVGRLVGILLTSVGIAIFYYAITY